MVYKNEIGPDEAKLIVTAMHFYVASHQGVDKHDKDTVEAIIDVFSEIADDASGRYYSLSPEYDS